MNMVKQQPLVEPGKIAEHLRLHGITPTQQRVDIAGILFSKAQHVSADQVLEVVNQDQALVSKATIYNTLGLFARKGLVREVIVDPSKVFYDSNVAEHHHFYNVDTGELIDIEAANVKVENLSSLPAGMEVNGVDVIIRVSQSKA